MVNLDEVQIGYQRKHEGKEVGEVWARVKVACAGDRIYSHHLNLSTILNWQVTPDDEIGDVGYFVTTDLHDEGQHDNYGSVWAWTATDSAKSGSIWVQVHALGQ